MNKRLAISLATFVDWMPITVLCEQFGSGTHQALTESVERGPGCPFMTAAALVLPVEASQRWCDIRPQQLPTTSR